MDINLLSFIEHFGCVKYVVMSMNLGRCRHINIVAKVNKWQTQMV